MFNKVEYKDAQNIIINVFFILLKHYYITYQKYKLLLIYFT
jgi:hypothetical protein